jgi:hypothetical protein
MGADKERAGDSNAGLATIGLTAKTAGSLC